MAKRGTLDHEKTMDLADRLGIMEPFALGVLEAFWAWVAKYRPDGDLRGTRAALMARAIRYTGDADALMDALIGARWVDSGDDVLYVHDWHEHSDDTVDNALARAGKRYANGAIPRMRRLERPERARLMEQFYSDECALNATESASKRTESAQNVPASAFVRTESARRAHGKPLPEPEPCQIPEPESKPDLKPSCAEASSAPPLGTLPCLGGKSWPFTQADVSAWAEAYPAIDVLAELRKDREWLKANPRNMKTLGGMRKHVNSWLARAQNEARGDPKPASRSMQQPGYNPDSPEGRVFTRDDIEKLREKRTRGEPMSPLLSDLVDRYDREMQTAQLSGVM